MASSESSGSSQSTSTPVVTETPENAIIDQISGVASGLAQQMLSWANSTFAQTSAITNQAVGNFFQTSQKMLGLSNSLTDQYNSTFAPENKQLVDDANSYNSAARQKVDMGMAGATQAQAGDQALKNSEESLRSYGIDPSSGRYAALDKAAAVQNAANVAGAENMQRDRDVQTGQNLRTQAVQVGAQLPAAIANVTNTAIQANTGASNASLANANTGRNLMSLPNDFLKTAMDVKMPLQGQNSQSTSSQHGSSSSPDPQQRAPSGGSGSPGSGSGGGGGGGPAWMPTHGNAQPSTSSGGGGGGRGGSAAGIMHLPDSGGSGIDWANEGAKIGQMEGETQGAMQDLANQSDTSGNIYQNDPNGGGNMSAGPQTEGDIWGGSTGAGGWNGSFGDTGAGGMGQILDPNSEAGGGMSDGTYGGMSGGTDTQFGNISYDPAANDQGAAADWGKTYDQPAATDWGDGASQQSGGQTYDTSSPGSDYYAGDYSDPSSGYDPGGAYARGGAIPGAPQPGATTGGMVPKSASPSMGRQTDDVPANLNADEFVIPRDVALWKGQEFFQNLIDQSRKKRVTAPAQGKPAQPGQANPAMTQQPTFTSRPMR